MGDSNLAGAEEVQEILDLLEAEEAQEPVPSDHTKRVLRAASVVPIGSVPSGNRRVCKKASSRLSPRDLSEEEQAEAQRERLIKQAEFVDRDALVLATRELKGPKDTLQLVKERIAMSAASLDHHRVELLKAGVSQKEIPHVISRQIGALKEIAHIELEIHKLSASVVDLNDERLQKVFALLIDVFRSVVEDLLDPKEYDLVLNRLETELEGWEDKAQALLR